MHNADVLFKEDSTVDDLIDVIEVCCTHGLLPAAMRRLHAMCCSD